MILLGSDVMDRDEVLANTGGGEVVCEGCLKKWETCCEEGMKENLIGKLSFYSSRIFFSEMR